MKKTILKYITFSIAGLIMINSCIKPVDDFKIEEKDPKIVLNTILDPDSTFSVHVSSSIGALDKEELKYITNANVYIYENNKLVETLDEYKDGFYYKSGFLPVEKTQYKIIVEADGYEPIESYVTIPEKVVINEVDTVTVTEYNMDGYPYKRFQMNINLHNNTDVKNYFMIEVKNYLWDYIWDNSGFDYKIIDSVYLYDNIYLESKDPKIEIGLTSDGYIDSFSDYEEYERWGQKFVFTDKLMSSGNGIISIYIQNGYFLSENENDTVKQIDVILSEISEDYYLFLKGLSIYSDDPFDKFFVESVTLYSNVENGIGIVAAQSSSKYSMYLPVTHLEEFNME